MTDTKKKLTVMFFLASDNGLSPSLFTQLLAIKSAGFQQDTDVLVYFDPNEQGVPTRYFDVNRSEKARQTGSRIGDQIEPFRDLAGDCISPEEMLRLPGQSGLAAHLINNDEMNAEEALESFLTFCHQTHPAEQYLLFLAGHGLVVGSDAFLPDDNPNSAIDLKALGEILQRFSAKIKPGGHELELVAMHSCGMSAVEVAYELKGTASYMMASQGISFVGAWPYHRVMREIFNAIEIAGDGEVNVPDMMTSLHDLCFQSSADFMFAGHSTDLCLCSLNPDAVRQLNQPINELSKALRAGLQDDDIMNLILLAHWKSQSYWQETYTDLYDFCFCLRESCVPEDEKQMALKLACGSVIEKLSPNHSNKLDGPIVRSDYFGPDCQYSHGFSIYFPWSRPIEAVKDPVIGRYRNYAFTAELHDSSWLEFLESYFDETQRPPRVSEAGADLDHTNGTATEIASSSRRIAGLARAAGLTGSTALNEKVSPPDSGGFFSYTSIKNYSRGPSRSSVPSMRFLAKAD